MRCAPLVSEDRRVMVIGMFFFCPFFFILVCLVQQKQLAAALKVQEGNTMFWLEFFSHLWASVVLLMLFDRLACSSSVPFFLFWLHVCLPYHCGHQVVVTSPFQTSQSALLAPLTPIFSIQLCLFRVACCMLSECFKAVPQLWVPQACLYIDETVECV